MKERRFYVKLHAGMPMVTMIEEAEGGLRFWYKEIGCGCVEIIEPAGLTEEFCMIVDEEGLLKNSPTINPIASVLYGTHLHSQPIVGDALIAKNLWTNDGLETVGMTEAEYGRLMKLINKAMTKFAAGA